MSKPTPKTEYRSRVEDEDDDLDDLDDVLESFNKPSSSLGKRPAAPAASSAEPTGAIGAAGGAPAPADGEDDLDLESELMEGMEKLLRDLATANPPGVMPGQTAPATTAGAPETGLSSAEEEAAFQRAVEMMLSGEGMDALGLDKAKAGASASASASASRPRSAAPTAGPSAPAAGARAKDSFDETIRKTMASLNAGGAGATGAGAGEGMPDDIAALLRQLSENPSALDGLDGDDDELGGLLDGMMAQLMSREVLEEPMTELAAKYPEYLAKPPAGTSEADLEKYRKQHALVLQILAVFKRPAYTDDVDGKEVAKLVGEMQDLGGPPNEIMGELPEGMDLGALGGEEGCVVM